MMHARVRIRNVKMKNGGAEVRVLHNQRCENVAGCFQRDAVDIFNRRASKMAGYAVVVWDIHGCTSTASIASRDIPNSLLPEMAKAALMNRDIRTDCALDITGRPLPDGSA